jgi:phosphate-selective porin OprO/OprP
MISNKKLAVAVSGAVLLMAGQFALADSTSDIVDALVSKGVLTEEEGKLISKGHESKKKAEVKVSEKDGAFTLESANGRNTFTPTGRLHFDYRDSTTKDLITNGIGTNDTDTKSLADTFEIRRARMGFKGQIAKDFKYESSFNMIGGHGSNIVDVAYIDYARFNQVQLRVGKFKQPFGLEQLTSSNNIDFMERSYNDQLVPAKKYGAQLFGEPVAGVTYAGSTYQKNDEANDYHSDGLSYAGRLTTNFAEIISNKDSILHVGIAGRDESYSVVPSVSGNTSGTLSAGSPTRGTIFSFRSGARGLANAYRAQINGAVPVVQGATYGYNDPSPTTASVQSRALGLEAILAYNSYKLQGEFAKTDFKAINGGNTADAINADVDTWYGEALWNITGEKFSDAYKKGVNGAIKPKNDFNPDNGGWGAWQLGARIEGFSVTDANILGSTNSRFQGSTAKTAGSTDSYNTAGVSSKGGAKSYTAGINWIISPNARVMLNYTYTKFDYAFTPIDIAGGTRNTIDDEKIVGVRTQFMF